MSATGFCSDGQSSGDIGSSIQYGFRLFGIAANYARKTSSLPLTHGSGMHRTSSLSLRYAMLGICFGLLFPAVGLLLDGSILRDTHASLADAFREHPLHLLVALAPVILGAVFFAYGRAQGLRLSAIQESQTGQENFNFFAESVTDYAIYMLDTRGRVLNWNEGARKSKGYSSSEIIGKEFSIFYTPEDQSAGLPARSLQTARDEGICRTEGWRVRKDGTRFWADVLIQPVYDRQKQLIGYAKITRDRTQQMEDEQKLRHNAGHDGLTGLPNRTHFLAKLDSALSASIYTGDKVAVICIGLDEFKNVNDALGYTFGDEILGALGKKLSNCVRGTEVVGRFGGDEFIALKVIADEADLADFVARLENAANSVVELSQRGFGISGSIGYAVFPGDADDRDTLINNADLAMHRAKNSIAR
ncbi:MAG: hypothetical protein CL534_10595 [Ahrensia sp.]|nr:hypothetical protein [Ahrensia sp.]